MRNKLELYAAEWHQNANQHYDTTQAHETDRAAAEFQEALYPHSWLSMLLHAFR